MYIHKILNYFFLNLNTHALLFLGVFLFSFLPKVGSLLISDYIVFFHLLFLSKFIFKKDLIISFFSDQGKLALLVFFFLIYLFSVINILLIENNNLIIDFKIFRFFIYFVYINLFFEIFKKNFNPKSIIFCFQIIVIAISIISLFFIVNNHLINGIFFSKDSLWVEPLGNRLVDLSGYKFNLEYIGNTVNSFGIIIYFTFVIFFENFLLKKNNFFLFLSLLFIFLSILTFSQSSLLSIFIYLLFRGFIYFSKKYNFLLSLVIIMFIFFIVYYFLSLLLYISDTYFLGISRVIENINIILQSLENNEFKLPGTIADRATSYQRFFSEIVNNPSFFFIGFGLFSSEELHDQPFIIESSIFFSLFYDGIVLFMILNFFFLINFKEYHEKINFNFYSKILFYSLPSFYLVNLLSFQAIFNVSIFTFFWTIHLCSKTNDENVNRNLGRYK